MKKTILRVFARLGLAVPLCWCLSAPVAVAGEVAVSTHVPLESMNQVDYENYHQRLNQQIKGVASNTKEQNPATKEQAPSANKAVDQETESGYGKGYRARMERGGRAGRAGGGRSGAMSRGGGRNR